MVRLITHVDKDSHLHDTGLYPNNSMDIVQDRMNYATLLTIKVKCTKLCELLPECVNDINHKIFTTPYCHSAQQTGNIIILF